MHLDLVLNNLSIRRTARILRRDGFTLVELLVVIGIIAILAGVALGPITNGIKKAKQSSGVQQGHALGLAMYSYANDNSQLYPDAASADAGTVAAALLAGGYVSDPSIFSLSGDTAKTTLTTSNNTATTIKKAEVCWDFLGNGGSGVSSTKFTYLPLLWSTLGTATAPIFTTAAGSPITATPVAANPFGTDGIAVFYINNASTFVLPGLVGGVLTTSMVTGPNNVNPATSGVPSTYASLSGT